MKDEELVRRKLSEIEYQYFLREYRHYFEVLPQNCVHNHKHTPEIVEQDETDLSPTVKEGDDIRLCMLGSDNPEEWPGNICQDPLTAKRCPFFENKHNHQDALREYKERIADPKVLAHEYKDIAALKWTLESDPPVELSDKTLGQRIYFYIFAVFVKFQMWLRL
jgi:hypothetical protein